MCTTNFCIQERKQNESSSRSPRRKILFLRAFVCLRACPARLCGDEPVELVTAGALRMEDHRLLAGCRAYRSLPPSLRRVWRQARARRPLASPRPGTLGADDAGGAGEIPPGNARL